MGRALAFAFFALALIVSSSVRAAGVTYHGRLIDPHGDPVVSPVVKFRIAVRSPGSENCLMFSEIHTRNMSASQGTFAITLGDGTASTGNGETINSLPSTVDSIFQNRKLMNFPMGKCLIGTTYNPAAADGRRLMVEFDDGGTGVWEPLPEQSINFVPLSLESVTVGGYKGTELFRVTDGSQNPVALTPWSQADYTKLLGIVAGTDTTYLKTESDPTVLASVKDGVDWTELTGIPSTFAPSGHTHTVEQITSGSSKYFSYMPNGVECADGEVLKWVAASDRWECGTDTGGGAPSGSAGGDLDGTFPNPDVVKIRGSVVSATTPLAGQTLVYQSSAWTPVNFGIGHLRTAAGAAQFANASCTASQTLTWSSLTDTFSCTNIAIGAGAVTSGTLDIARLPTGTSGTTVAIGNDARFPSGTCASGNTMRFNGTAWVCEASAGGADNLGNHTATANLNLGANLLVGNGGSTGIAIDNSGKVGIGTPAPDARLHVDGSIKMVDGNQGAGKVLTSDANGIASWQSPSSGGLTNFTESVNTSAPNATIPVVRLLAANAAINVDIALSPKGMGALTAHVADGTAAGGDKRGPYAVDWQTARSATTQVASGQYAVISGGINNTASGTYANVGGGSGNAAIGDRSTIAGGQNNTTDGFRGATVGGGIGNTASEMYSTISGGDSNTASGGYSTVSGGQNNTASGQYSLAANLGTTSESYAQTTFGLFNELTGGDPLNWNSGDPLFVIGNGFDGSTRSNALTVLKNGRIGIGTTGPSEKLHVVGNLRVQGSTDCTLGNGSGGTNCSSDIRLKTNINEIENPLEKILALRGVEFDWNEKSQSPGKHSIGVIAQEVEKQFPTAVIEDSSTGYKKVDYAVLVAPIIQALKELFNVTQENSRDIAAVNAKTSKLEADNADLKAEVSQLKKQNESLQQWICSKDPSAPVCK